MYEYTCRCGKLILSITVVYNLQDYCKLLSQGKVVNALLTLAGARWNKRDKNIKHLFVVL